jgi:CelD/BcsL family acetyltransferase involved in cellulose biosynthesis
MSAVRSDHTIAAVPSNSTTVEATKAEATKPVGLAPRPAVDPAVLAVLAAAVDQAWPRLVVAPPSEPSMGPAWRFSGRWWTKPTAARRVRPWARG